MKPKVAADLDAFPGTRTEVSLTLPKGLSYKQTERLLGVIGVIERASPWWGCDALLYAEAAFGEDKFSQIAEALGWAPDVLSTRLWIARQVSAAVRREGLTFSHHAEVAALDPEDQDYWLGRAEAGESLPNGECRRWSKKKLRLELRALVPAKAAPKKKATTKKSLAGERSEPPTLTSPAAAESQTVADAVNVQAALLVEEALERVEEIATTLGAVLEKGMLIRTADSAPHRIVGIYIAPGELIVKAVSVAEAVPPPPEVEDPTWAEAAWGTPEALAHLYNIRAPDNVPAVETLSPKRRERARKLLKTFPHKSWWEEVFAEYARSKFLRGETKPDEGHKHFRPDFDWLLANGQKGAENVVRVHDGIYRQ
jgi:hypothetical protein